MNQRIQQKIEEYRKMAASQKDYTSPKHLPTISDNDSLAAVIRSKKDADVFMAELESAVKRSR